MASVQEKAVEKKGPTPMMRQFAEIKKHHPDAILFFRMGDFYEMFFDDAVETARLLDLTLTKRAGVPMCGVPHHAVENYIARMIKIGRKIAICDQVEDPKTAKGIVKREVTQVITPGTVVDNTFLDTKANNYLLTFTFAEKEEGAAIAVVDISTAEFLVSEMHESVEDAILDEVTRFSPKEILLPESYEESAFVKEMKARYENVFYSTLPDWVFEANYASDTVEKHFRVTSLKGLGLEGKQVLTAAAGGVLYYLSEMQKGILPHIRTLHYYHREDYIILDDATQVNLELTANIQSGSRERTLLDVIDYTLTNMGGRKLKRFLLQPLIKVPRIQERLEKVSFFFETPELRKDVRARLNEILDIERLTTKVALSRINPKELVALKRSLVNAIECITMLAQAAYDDPRFEAVEDARRVTDIIERAILEEPAIAINEGGIIKDAYHPKLQEYNAARREGRTFIANLEKRYRDETGIQKLKIRYNNVIGYFIEVTKSHAKDVPDSFVKRQTLVGSERYTTEELSTYEVTLNEANAKGFELEYELYCDVRANVKEYLPALQSISEAVAHIDVFSALAELAHVKAYTRPVVHDGYEVRITGGRHPVVEYYLDENRFIPNDVLLDDRDNRLHIITGPNMSGKSTYLRQTALIVLLAQIGSFVPAEEAAIGVVDRIFTRVGASDSIARGESTFLVEMNETANILHHCTDRSLIIMDEIGRGTSTYDGMSIAWAIIEFLVGTKGKGSKTLFATHYHELTLLDELEGVKNMNVSVKEHKDEIVFLKKVIEGAATSSYGIYAAKIAGVPDEVTHRAEEILSQLEKDGKVQVNILEERYASAKLKRRNMLPLFENEVPEVKESEIEKKVLATDVNNITPLDALTLIGKWQNELRKR